MNANIVAMDLATRILIVDDDEEIRELMSGFLGRHGFKVATADDAAGMRRALEHGRYDLIVLDVMMPGEDGLTALRSLQGTGAPAVIMLSAVGTDVDRIVGLELGADDYLVKPCNPRELLARIRTVMRRVGTAPEVPVQPEPRVRLQFAGFRLDPVGRILTGPAGRELSLTDAQFRLLRAFVEHPRRVLTRDQLLEYSAGEDADSYDRAIDVQVSRLRRKLADAEGGDGLIRTVRSEGYMFTAHVHRA